MLTDINQTAREDPVGFIAQGEAAYSEAILHAAHVILQRRRHCPIVLLSGPSGSGKTTTAHRVSDQLARWGIRSVPLSMDNYLLPLSDPAVRDENGRIDLESPRCLDVALLCQQISVLIRGGEIILPQYNFVTKERSFSEKPMRLEPDTVIVLEGIHALNDAVTGSFSQFATGMYISMRSRIQKPDGSLIAPHALRVIRRILRDYQHRGRSAGDTVRMWESVERGEQLYILPYKGHADISINSMFSYEGCVTCPLTRPLLEESRGELEKMARGRTILDTAALFSVIDRGLVPSPSLLHEFIG